MIYQIISNEVFNQSFRFENRDQEVIKKNNNDL